MSWARSSIECVTDCPADGSLPRKNAKISPPAKLRFLIARSDLRFRRLGTGCVGEKPKFSHHPSRQLLGRGFVAPAVLALSSAVAFSTSSPTAEVTDDAALAAWREASCT